MDFVHKCISCVNADWDPEMVVASYGVIGSLNKILPHNVPDLPYDCPLEQTIHYFNSKVDLYNPLLHRHNHFKLEKADNFLSVFGVDSVFANMQLRSFKPKDYSESSTLRQLQLRFSDYGLNSSTTTKRDVSEQVGLTATFSVPSLSEHFKVLDDFKKDLLVEKKSNEFLLEG